VIPEAVVMETTAIEAELSAPATGVMEGTTSELGAAVAPEVMVETHVDAHPGMSMEVVVREPKVQEVAPIRSDPMS
jgi:hypothetical protein